MALIACSECGKEISYQAVVCPSCGVARGVWTDWRGFQLLSIPLILMGAIAVLWVRPGHDDGTLADIVMIAGYVGACLLVAATIGRLYQSTARSRIRCEVQSSSLATPRSASSTRFARPSDSVVREV